MQTWKVKKREQKRVRKPWITKVIAVLLLLITVFVGVYDFPFLWNRGAAFVQAQTGWLPPTISETPYRLGLDLQGGTHLTYEADMTQIPVEDREKALEGVKDVIERRVNAFGVSEPVVQTTTTGGVYRVIIELAGVLDVTQAIALIGETPVLEFKTPGQEVDREPTPQEQELLDTANEQERIAARAALNRALAGENFDALVEEFSIEKDKETKKGILEHVTADSFFAEYAIVIQERGLRPGNVYGKLLENDSEISIFKYLNPSEQKEVLLSHILICFEGKTGCQKPIPALEASIQIGKIKDQVTPENFAELAKQNSTDGSAPNGGDLGWGTLQDFVAPFSLAASTLQNGQISEIVETDFGYHLIYKRDERTSPGFTIQRILMEFTDFSDIAPEASAWVNSELSGKQLERAGVEFDPNSGAPYVAIIFNSEGAELFAQLTEKFVGQPIAIFLDGSAISTPVVQQAIYGGQAVITGDFSLDEAKILAQRLNAGALPVPVHLISQQTVGPTLGAISLEKSINAALLGFVLVALYMIILYRVPGLVAVVALTLFALLNLAAYRFFDVTITLAGIAGFVLSIGIAVDANVLITERFKEEYASGRDFVSATIESFRRAWTAIRDGNLTTLIAAAVLYWFSSSFVRGFALTLSIGVILSMFTAIVVTRVYLLSLLDWRFIRKPYLFGVKKSV